MEMKMEEVKNIALDRAIRMLEAAGCSFAIITPDGERYGDLQIIDPDERKRAPLRYEYGAISGHYRRYLSNLAPVGSVTQVPFGDFTADEIRGGCCSYLSKEWGNGTYITNVASDHVEILRIA